MDPGLFAGLVKSHRAVHHSVIGDGERGLPHFPGALCSTVDAAGTVQERVFTVNVKMNKTHVSSSYSIEEEGLSAASASSWIFFRR